MTKFVTDWTKSALSGPRFQTGVDEFALLSCKTLRVNICALGYIRPPVLEFVGAFAPEDEKAIGFPERRLMDEVVSVVNSVIILIFKEGRLFVSDHREMITTVHSSCLKRTVKLGQGHAFWPLVKAIMGGLPWNGTKTYVSLVKFHIRRARIFAMTSTAMSVETVNGR